MRHKDSRTMKIELKTRRVTFFLLTFNVDIDIDDSFINANYFRDIDIGVFLNYHLIK